MESARCWWCFFLLAYGFYAGCFGTFDMDLEDLKIATMMLLTACSYLREKYPEIAEECIGETLAPGEKTWVPTDKYVQGVLDSLTLAGLQEPNQLD